MSNTRTPPVRRSQAERRAETQKRLYQAALECLVERGYAAMTLNEVVKRAGLSSGALWRYCKTKADLAYAAVRFAEDEERAAQVAGLGASAGDPQAFAAAVRHEPSDLLSRGGLELMRAGAVDEQVRELLAAGSWQQWLGWSTDFLQAVGADTLDERTASTVRVLSLATAALRVFFRDEDIATVLRGDIELLATEALEHYEPAQRVAKVRP